MADTDQIEITDEHRALAEELNFGPQDLASLPEWIKLAKELGIDLKDLLINKNSSAVTIKNHTQHTLYFMREENRVSGAFKTTPPDEIAPGATGTFLSGEASFLGLAGDEASVVYAVGAPEHCQWTIHWNNPESGANTADHKLAFPSGQTRPDGTVIQFWAVEEFAKRGSTVSPFDFILREEGFGGGADGVVDRNSCVITIMNETRQSLFLNETHFNDGDIVTFPDDEVPPDGQTTFEVSEKRRPDHRREGVSGFARFSVTQDPGHALWTVSWANPEQGENVADQRLDGTSTNLYQAGPPMMPRDQKERTPVRFVLRDAGGGAVVPPQERETPPPETDEPTLRHGDQSVDGWVEYLQDLLEFWGAEPGERNGVFGQGTLAAVRRFQQRMKAEKPEQKVMVDGIVGHQTWALLREEDPRPPSTDGRQPHTYVERGPEARWYQEDNWVFYDPGRDRLEAYAYNVGEVRLEQNGFTATADLTRQSDGMSLQVHLFGPADGPVPTGTDLFPFALDNASQTIPAGTWTVHAWLEPDLGGDDHNGVVVVER